MVDGPPVNTRPRSACARSLAPPRWSTPKRRYRRSWSNADSTLGSWIGVWTSDITNQRTGQCWLYLCAIRDGCPRRVIGWTIDEHIRADLVESALAMAIAMCGRAGAGAVRPQAQSDPFSRARWCVEETPAPNHSGQQ